MEVAGCDSFKKKGCLSSVDRMDTNEDLEAALFGDMINAQNFRLR